MVIITSNSISSEGKEESQNINKNSPLKRTFSLVLMSDQYRYTKTTGIDIKTEPNDAEQHSKGLSTDAYTLLLKHSRTTNEIILDLYVP